MARKKKLDGVQRFTIICGAVSILAAVCSVVFWYFPRDTNESIEDASKIDIRATESTVSGVAIQNETVDDRTRNKNVTVEIGAEKGSKVSDIFIGDVHNAADPELKERVDEVFQETRQLNQNVEKSRNEAAAREAKAKEGAYQAKVAAHEFGIDFQTSGDETLLNMRTEEFERLIDHFTDLGNDNTVAKSYLVLGAIAEKQGKLDKAKQYWLQAKGLYSKGSLDFMVRRMEERIDSLLEK